MTILFMLSTLLAKFDHFHLAIFQKNRRKIYALNGIEHISLTHWHVEREI